MDSAHTRHCRKRCVAIGIALATAFYNIPSFAVTSAMWDGSSANWSDSIHWSSIPNFPSNGTPSGTLYDATINAGTLTLDISPGIQKLTLGAAALKGEGTLTASDLFTWNAGSNSTLAAANMLATAGIDFHGSGVATLTGALLLNASSSTATLGASGNFALALGSTSTFTNAGTLTATNGAIQTASSSLATFNNTGLLVINKPGGVFTITGVSSSPTAGLTFSNSGTANVLAGTLSLQVQEGSNSGTFLVAAGAKISFNSDFSFSATSSISGAGDIVFTQNAYIINGDYNVTGATTPYFGGTHITFAGPDQHAGAILGGKGDITVAQNAHLTSDGVYLFTPLTINGLYSIRPGGANTVRISVLNLAGSTGHWTGTLDLADNKFSVNPNNAAAKAVAFTTLADQLTSGKNSGADGPWTGSGITSSTLAADTTHSSTLALIDNADLHLTSFGGRFADSNSLFIATAAIGDADLSGSVDLLDFDIWFNHLGQNTYAYNRGDFNTDGIVDLLDFDLWFNYLGSNGNALQPGSSSLIGIQPIPEPASVAMLLTALPLLIRFRRKRQP